MPETKIEITRPDGRIYKPSKPPRGVLVDDSYAQPNEPTSYVYVLGTHDVNVAYELARQIAASEGMKADVHSAERTWLRLAMRNGERVYDHDPVKGAAAVTFEVID